MSEMFCDDIFQERIRYDLLRSHMSQLILKDTRNEVKCKFCNDSMEGRMQCHAMKNSGWKYLFENEHCHIECYIDHCVEMSIKARE